MNTFTDLEIKVYNALVILSTYDYGAEVHELAEATGETINTVKGVVGSLTKKGAVYPDELDVNGENQYNVILLNIPDNTFLSDNYSDEEILALKK